MTLRSPAARAFLALAALAAPSVADLHAVTGQAWVLRSRGDYNDARLDGVTLSPEGRVALSPSVTRLAEAPQPFIWCLGVDPKGRVHAGGGNEGQVFRLGPGGADVVLDAAELEIHAIAFDASGRLLAGSSPDGRVYRVEEGSAPAVVFDPDAVYIWALAVDGAGNLLVATGQPGRIYRVASSGRSEILLDAREESVRALTPDGRGGFYAASDGGGIVWRIAADGKVSVLYDSPAREIAALAVSGGDLYAAALTPAPARGGARTSGEARGAVTRVRVTAEGGAETEEGGESSAQEPAQGQAAPQRAATPTPESYTGAVYRISPEGYGRKIWESRDTLPLSILGLASGSLLVGTGDRGRLIALTPAGEASDLAEVEGSQVNALARGPGGSVLAGTSNLGAVWRVSDGYASEGTITGGVRDAGITSRWGAIAWDADTPGKTRIQVQVRTGDTETPDATWSEWSGPYRDARGSVIDRPAARYVQWRATFASEGASTPVLRALSIHYLPDNVPPEIESVDVLNPGILLQPAASSSGDEGGEGGPRRPAPSRRSFQRGMRSVTWKASDGNGDTLRAEVFYRAEDETAWKRLEAGLEEDFFAWDSTAMPDGVYRLKVVVSDDIANPPGRGLAGAKESGPFDVDNTPPSVADVRPRLSGRSAEVVATVADTFSVVGDVAYSVDASDWVMVLPEDGVADATRETFRFTLADLVPGEHSIVVRARDRAGNAASGKAIVRVP